MDLTSGTRTSANIQSQEQLPGEAPRLENMIGMTEGQKYTWYWYHVHCVSSCLHSPPPFEFNDILRNLGLLPRLTPVLRPEAPMLLFPPSQVLPTSAAFGGYSTPASAANISFLCGYSIPQMAGIGQHPPHPHQVSGPVYQAPAYPPPNQPFRTICWDCKFGSRAKSNVTVQRCRTKVEGRTKTLGHTAPDWRCDPRGIPDAQGITQGLVGPRKAIIRT
jgi:hypothetical protein